MSRILGDDPFATMEREREGEQPPAGAAPRPAAGKPQAAAAPGAGKATAAEAEAAPRAAKAGARKAGARKAGTRKAGTRKAGARKAGAEPRAEAGARKAGARKAGARKASARKASARKASARKAGAEPRAKAGAVDERRGACTAPPVVDGERMGGAVPIEARDILDAEVVDGVRPATVRAVEVIEIETRAPGVVVEATPAEAVPADLTPGDAPAPAGVALVPVPRPPPAVPLPRQARALSPLGRRYRELAMRGRSPMVDPFGLDPLAQRRYQPVLDLLYERYFRVEARGVGHVPDHGRALLVANRAGTLPYDSLMLGQAVRREHPLGRLVRPLLEDYAFHAPYLGVVLSRLGGVRACPENAELLLEGEQLVAVFPEGQKGSGKPYGERYRLQRFGRGGFVRLALRTRTPILPVAILGSEEAQPLLGKLGWLGRLLGLPHLPLTPTFPWLGPLGLLPLPSKWSIAIGEPLYLHTEYDPQAAEDQALLGRLAEQVRHRIQEMLDGMLARRHSVLWG